MKISAFALAAGIGLAGTAFAQPAAVAPPPAPPYGMPLTLAQAKSVAAAARAEADRLKAPATIAVVDVYGEMVLVERGPDTQYASVDMVLAKARSAVGYRRGTQFFADQLKAGNLTVTQLPGGNGMGPGGVLLIAGGRIVGALGVNGGAEVQVAQAGAAALQ